MSFVLTHRVAKELMSHEAIVQEAYKDSVGVWTWSVGITNRSGHQVHPRYLDNPQTLKKCLEIYIWLLKMRYIPDVEQAFSGFNLNEAKFCAALSFHFNTGGIAKASWVKQWKDGNIQAARTSFMNWNKPPEIVGRRRKERDLFFDGTWSGDGRATVYPVRKPSYSPHWAGARKVDVDPILQELLGA